VIQDGNQGCCITSSIQED